MLDLRNLLVRLLDPAPGYKTTIGAVVQFVLVVLFALDILSRDQFAQTTAIVSGAFGYTLGAKFLRNLGLPPPAALVLLLSVVLSGCAAKVGFALYRDDRRAALPLELSYNQNDSVCWRGFSLGVPLGGAFGLPPSAVFGLDMDWMGAGELVCSDMRGQDVEGAEDPTE